VTRRALAAYFFGVLAFSLGVSSTANAWCQSCTVARVRTEAGNACPPQPCECRLDEGELWIAWNQRCISYSLHQAGSADIPRAEYERIVADSFAEWTSASCGASPVGFEVEQTDEDAQGSTAEFASEGGNVNVVAFVRDWDERDYLPSAYAVTVTWFGVRSGEIFDADILLNEEYWDWSECPETGCTGGRDVDLKNTLVHESGHFLGLAHSGEGTEASTMWSCAPPGEVIKRDVDADDIEGLCSIYPAGSLEEACTFEPVGGFNPSPIALRPSGCGCRVSRADPSAGYAFVLLGVLFWRRRRSR
jgi:MYXO-CTERM domain-containing protein